MPVSISEHVGIVPEVFAQTGAFDAILDIDSKLFIDPHLLQATTTPELANSYQKITKRFEEILHILTTSKQENDVFWREAVRRFDFPELRGLCIGYSSKSTLGSGMGEGLRTNILRTAKQIVDAGIQDPVIFELIGLFEENIGPDRISDMVGRIIVDDLRAYTQRIFSELKVETTPIKNSPYESVINPFSRYPLILLPQDVLRDLPIAESWSEIDIVCAHNRELRQKLNELIGDTWKKATKVKKSILRTVLIREPEVLHDLIESYRNKPADKYDFESDPAGQVIWLAASRKYVKEFPLSITLPDSPSPEDLLQIVLTICDKFKDLVENNGLYSLLYDSSGKHKKEEAAQKVFYGIADSYCSANNLDLSREANAGRGPVDFKISKGYKGRVVVEAKLTTNPQLLHGFEVQIEEYKKAEKTRFSVYLVIDVAEGRATQVKALKKRIADSKAAGLRVPEVVFVDAKPKKSASKY
ncbi:MAG TPA: hypothetical protein VF588_07870 [Pyrinomonadaceae bacterium]